MEKEQPDICTQTHIKGIKETSGQQSNRQNGETDTHKV